MKGIAGDDCNIDPVYLENIEYFEELSGDKPVILDALGAKAGDGFRYVDNGRIFVILHSLIIPLSEGNQALMRIGGGPWAGTADNAYLFPEFRCQGYSRDMLSNQRIYHK